MKLFVQYCILISLYHFILSCSPAGTNMTYSGNPLDPLDATPLETSNTALPPQQEPHKSLEPGSYAQLVQRAPFYAEIPNADSTEKKILSADRELKVISSNGAYVKVEVIKTGETGYVPQSLIESNSPIQSAAPQLVEQQKYENFPRYKRGKKNKKTGRENEYDPLDPGLVDPGLVDPASYYDQDIPNDDIPSTAPEPLNQGLYEPETVTPPASPSPEAF